MILIYRPRNGLKVGCKVNFGRRDRGDCVFLLRRCLDAVSQLVVAYLQPSAPKKNKAQGVNQFNDMPAYDAMKADYTCLPGQLNAPDFSTFHTPGPKGYADYPALS